MYRLPSATAFGLAICFLRSLLRFASEHSTASNSTFPSSFSHQFVHFWVLYRYYLFINKICKRGHLSYGWLDSISSQSMRMWLWYERKRRRQKTCNSTTAAPPASLGCPHWWGGMVRGCVRARSNFKLHCDFVISCGITGDWYAYTNPQQLVIYFAQNRIQVSKFTIHGKCTGQVHSVHMVSG